MATTEEVRRYLAYWFQLGKKVLIGTSKVIFLPQSVLEGDQYSQEFEECWRKIISQPTGDCHLEGTQETITELLTPAWEIVSCGRCAMPVPMRNPGMPATFCPCHSLATWPNTELPLPRSPVNSQEHLIVIRDRLLNNIPENLTTSHKDE
jgi:hypothetical protein